MEFQHASIMVQEVLQALQPRSGGLYADVTLGGGGHAEAILERSGPDGQLLGVDRDPHALAAARARLERFGARATLMHGTFSQLASMIHSLHGAQGQWPRPCVDGLVADLGVSSPQLDHAERGFSFSKPGPLDMRMDPTTGRTARDWIHELTERELADVLFEYGEERKSHRVARAIKHAVHDDRMHTTEDLRSAVVRALGPRKVGRIDPATRTFQALRILVNRELQELDVLVQALPEVLCDQGVAAVLTFHSLEDRRVKHAFRDHEGFIPLTKKPVVASSHECEENPRARSAKLRAARRSVSLERGEATALARVDSHPAERDDNEPASGPTTPAWVSKYRRKRGIA
jgi:16S rRNA (cytosine1402-N4)-methyltransferase